MADLPKPPGGIWRNRRSDTHPVSDRRVDAGVDRSARCGLLNRDVRDKSLVLNGLIRSKEFSWTLIFSDLEHLMPTRLHVLSITPQLDVNNDIEVHMVVAGDSREKAIELIKNMEKSREFRHAQVLSETETRREQGGTQAGDTVQFEIIAQYVPITPVAAAVPEMSGQ